MFAIALRFFQQTQLFRAAATEEVAHRGHRRVTGDLRVFGLRHAMSKISESEWRLRSEAYAIADVAIEELGKSIGAFVAIDPARGNRYSGLGSGFLVCFEGNVFLVTAAHVVAMLVKQDAVMFVNQSNEFGSKAFWIAKMGFTVEPANDLAAAKLTPEQIAERNIAVALDLLLNTEPVAGSEETAVFYCALGYPAEWNDFRHGRIDTKIQGVSPWEPMKKPKSCAVEDAICLKFLPKTAFLSDGIQPRRLEAAFNGMSGGAIVQISATRERETEEMHYRSDSRQSSSNGGRTSPALSVQPERRYSIS
jgi:hypothetical protein